MKVTLLGFTLPDEDMDAVLAADPNMPSQTHAFAWALVGALRSAEIGVRLLSCAPVSNYPQNPRICFRSKPFTANGIDGETLGFVNALVLKHLSRFATCVTRATPAIRRWRPDVLMIHGVHSPFLLYGVLNHCFTSVKSVVVVTDPPGVVLPSDGVLARTLKHVDVRLVKWALRFVDGAIVLTAPLARDFAPRTRSIVMEGIVHGSTPARPGQVAGSRFCVMYAGGLSAPYGVERLVNAIQTLSSDDVRLVTYGKGPLKSWIDDQSSMDDRVESVQFAKREVVLEEYVAADLLVQPRPVDQDFVRYSFPSKLLEYMASGTPVLSTRLPGIPPEYEPYVYWIADDSVEGIDRALRETMAVPADERAAKGRSAARFVFGTCSAEAQGARIRDFLAEVLRS